MEETFNNWYVLLWNLDSEQAVLELGAGVSIRHLGDSISIFDLAAAGAVGFREWGMLEPYASACVSEIETAQDSAVAPGYDTLNRAWLASTLLKLKGYNAHLPLACSAYSWNMIAGHQKRTIASTDDSTKPILPRFKGQLLELHTKFLIPDNSKTKLCEEDAYWIRNNYEKFNSIAAESESFKFALTSAVDWQYSTDPRIAIARLWSGIEAIFGINSELVYRISLLVASLLEPRGLARKARFDQVRKLYGVRSKAVHGEELSDNKLNKAMVESFDILSKLLLITVERGRPFTQDDFEKVTFY